METNNTHNGNSYEQLKALMQKEIHLMREMLTNMHQEETSLRSNDKSGWAQALSERAQILRILSPLREERIQITKIIEKTVPKTDDCEIVSMCEQLMTLIQKVNTQNILNERLSTESSHNPYLLQKEELTKKKKSYLATYSEEDENIA